MNKTPTASRTTVWVAWGLRGLAAVIAIAGVVGAVGVWAIMATYPDDKPNSLLQNLGPLLVYALPAWAVALGLLWLARRIARRA